MAHLRAQGHQVRTSLLPSREACDEVQRGLTGDTQNGTMSSP